MGSCRIEKFQSLLGLFGLALNVLANVDVGKFVDLLLDGFRVGAFDAKLKDAGPVGCARRHSGAPATTGWREYVAIARA